MAAKRADDFEAGEPVVWDVDPAAGCVHIDRAADPETPVPFRRGEKADAEPAVPGRRMAVDRVFGRIPPHAGVTSQGYREGRSACAFDSLNLVPVAGETCRPETPGGTISRAT